MLCCDGSSMQFPSALGTDYLGPPILLSWALVCGGFLLSHLLGTCSMMGRVTDELGPRPFE